jgi:DNA-binding transcriptional LysR family regulator
MSTCSWWTYRSDLLNNAGVDLRRLRLLLELSRLGSMREVADEMHVTTSTVSQQLTVLAKEAGATLIEPDGRRVRLTPAGRRLAEHAVSILAAVDAARLDLDPDAAPAGTVRAAGFASAVRRALVPIAIELAVHRPTVALLIHEHEPAEAFALLAADAVDLALTYDYNLAPAPFDHSLEPTPLWSTSWSLCIPATSHHTGNVTGNVTGNAPANARAVFARFRDEPWIVNSRNTADEVAVRTIASMAGFEPRIAHRIDSLELVQDLIAAGLGVGLLPADEPVRPGVELLALADPEVIMRAYAVTRRGRAGWPPLALVVGLLTGA